MNRIVASVVIVCCLSGCREERPGPGSRLDTAFVYWMLLQPVLACGDARMYRYSGSCILPAASPYVYNAATAAFADTTVTGIVSLECRPIVSTLVTWGKISTPNPAPGSSISHVTGSGNLSTYSVGDSLFCVNWGGPPYTFHKVTVL